jgi:hypothetical protein
MEKGRGSVRCKKGQALKDSLNAAAARLVRTERRVDTAHAHSKRSLEDAYQEYQARLVEWTSHVSLCKYCRDAVPLTLPETTKPLQSRR